MNKYMTATQARQNFFTLIKTAKKPGVAITIIHEGSPGVVVMSSEDYEGWMETFEIMSDPELSQDLLKMQKSKRKEKTVSWEKVKKELRL